MKIGKRNFRYGAAGVYGPGWIARVRRGRVTVRLIVRKSIVRPTMWCADYKIGSQALVVMKLPDNKVRRFKTKESAACALVDFDTRSHA